MRLLISSGKSKRCYGVVGRQALCILSVHHSNGIFLLLWVQISCLKALEILSPEGV
jgi:hypothetical protein